MPNDTKTVMAVLIENRKETTEQVQKILTVYGNPFSQADVYQSSS